MFWRWRLFAAFGDERLPERFWTKCEVISNGCWLWLACVNQDGYARYGSGGVVRYAHRVAYETLLCSAFGLTLDHHCRNRSCCNPNHLEAVSQTINNRRNRKLRCHAGHLLLGDNRVEPYGICRACGIVRSRRYYDNHGRKKPRRTR